jgi:hypothetical protein
MSYNDKRKMLRSRLKAVQFIVNNYSKLKGVRVELINNPLAQVKELQYNDIIYFTYENINYKLITINESPIGYKFKYFLQKI